MAITFRNVKGSSLTHDELDNNFREFFYSASVEGSAVIFHRYTALSSSLSFPIDPPSGRDGHIQLKSGNVASGANAIHTASANFLFDYNNNHLKVTGSHTHVGTLTVEGNESITGNLVVDGTVTAEEFITERVATSYIYKSGSTKFGDDSQDNHAFTGSLGVLGTVDVTGPENKIRFHFADTSSLPSATTYHGMFAHTHAEGKAWYAHAGSWVELATSESIASNYLKNTTDTLEGDLTVTGRVTAQEFHTELVSSSITYDSGSHKFGDSADDNHEFTGSVNIKGGTVIEGILTATSINGTITGSIDNATTASYIDATNIDGTVASASFSTTASAATSITFNGGLTTTSDVQFDSLGVGVAATGTTGEIVATGDITAYYSSDKRLKDNITPLGNALDKINQIGGYEFDWNNNSNHSGHDVGVIAQEIEKVLPEVVVDRDTGYKAVRYDKIVALLINAVKEQQLQIDELKSKL